MQKVNILSFAQLRNAEHVAFFNNVSVALTKTGAEALGLTADQLTSFKLNVDTEQDIVNRSMASVYTPEMKEMDDERDRLFRLIRLKLQAVTLASPGSELASYATITERDLLNKYDNSLCMLPYQEESAVLNGFILDTREFLGDEAIEAIGFAEELAELESANKAFANMYNERVTEKAGAGTEKTKALRKETEEQFSRIACHVEYKVNASDNGIEALGCKELLGVINQIFSDARTRLNVRLGRAEEGPDYSGVVPPVFNK